MKPWESAPFSGSRMACRTPDDPSFSVLDSRQNNSSSVVLCRMRILLGDQPIAFVNAYQHQPFLPKRDFPLDISASTIKKIGGGKPSPPMIRFTCHAVEEAGNERGA